MSLRCRCILATRSKGICLSLDAQKRKQSEKCNEFESNLNARDATAAQDNVSSYLQRHPHEENESLKQNSAQFCQEAPQKDCLQKSCTGMQTTQRRK